MEYGASLWQNKFVLLPGTGIQSNLTHELEEGPSKSTGKRPQTIYERAFRALLVTSSTVGNWTEKSIPRRLLERSALRAMRMRCKNEAF